MQKKLDCDTVENDTVGFANGEGEEFTEKEGENSPPCMGSFFGRHSLISFGGLS